MTTQNNNKATCTIMLLEVKIQCCGDLDTKCPAKPEQQVVHTGGDPNQQTPTYYHREIF